MTKYVRSRLLQNCRMREERVNPFPTYRHLLTPLPQMTFENIVAKGDIAQNDKFLLSTQFLTFFQTFSFHFRFFFAFKFWPKYFQFYSMIQLSFREVYNIFNQMFSIVICCRFAECGKRNNQESVEHKTQQNQLLT